MKKLGIITLSLLSSSAFSNNYVVLIDEKTNSYEVGGFTDNVETSEWILKETNCSVDKTESEVYYGKTYLQTETCVEEYERTITKIRTYSNGSSEIMSVKQEINQSTLIPTTKNIIGTHLESSCKNILENGYSNGNDVYTIDNNKLFPVYCDMTTNGGGWTMIFALFEQDNVNTWNEGIQSDYDPTLSTSKSFTLSTTEIPRHSEISFSQTNALGLMASSHYFDFVYSPLNIGLQTIKEKTTNLSYHIHRDDQRNYGWHDPDDYVIGTGGIGHVWSNTLTINKILIGQRTFDFAYSINHVNPERRGYAYNGVDMQLTNQTGGWTLWVR